jgi:hypothetical protein
MGIASVAQITVQAMDMQPDSLTVAAYSTAADAIGYNSLSEYICDTRCGPEMIASMFRRAYARQQRKPDKPIAIILLAGLVARGEAEGPELAIIRSMCSWRDSTRDTHIATARAEAKRIVTESSKRIAFLAEVIEKLGDLVPAAIDDDEDDLDAAELAAEDVRHLEAV